MDAALHVLAPGVSAAALGRAAIEANDGVRPWIEHFYLAHGVGTDSAEMPLVGTDLGPEFDESQVMQPGMVLVLEPVIWDDGAGGYRAEDIVAVTDTGWEPLSGSTYDPLRPGAMTPALDREAIVGTMALEDSARVDFERLRRQRRHRLLEAMAAERLDALGARTRRQRALRLGARQLWRAGSAPFGPAAVVVLDTRRVHLLSVWDEGVPPEIDHEDLYPLTWNPAHLLAALKAIPGLGRARRVGTDGLTPTFAQHLHEIAPSAELADAEPGPLGSASDEDGRRAGLPAGPPLPWPRPLCRTCASGSSPG